MQVSVQSQFSQRPVSVHSQASLRSVSAQSQVSLRSVPGQSQVSLRSVPGKSKVFLGLSELTSSRRSLKYFVLLIEGQDLNTTGLLTTLFVCIFSSVQALYKVLISPVVLGPGLKGLLMNLANL